jgi:hypothetical protein
VGLLGLLGWVALELSLAIFSRDKFLDAHLIRDGFQFAAAMRLAGNHRK